MLQASPFFLQPGDHSGRSATIGTSRAARNSEKCTRQSDHQQQCRGKTKDRGAPVGDIVAIEATGPTGGDGIVLQRYLAN